MSFENFHLAVTIHNTLYFTIPIYYKKLTIVACCVLFCKRHNYYKHYNYLMNKIRQTSIVLLYYDKHRRLSQERIEKYENLEKEIRESPIMRIPFVRKIFGNYLIAIESVARYKRTSFAIKEGIKITDYKAIPHLQYNSALWLERKLNLIS